MRFPNPFRRAAERIVQAERAAQEPGAQDAGLAAEPAPETTPDLTWPDEPPRITSFADLADPLDEPEAALLDEPEAEEFDVPDLTPFDEPLPETYDGTVPEAATDAAPALGAQAAPEPTPAPAWRPLEPATEPEPVTEPAWRPLESTAAPEPGLEPVAEATPTMVLPEVPHLAPAPVTEPAPVAAEDAVGGLPPRIGAFAATLRILVMPRSTFVRVSARETRAWIPAIIMLVLLGAVRAGAALFELVRTPGTLPETPSVALWTTFALVGPTLFAITGAAWFWLLTRTGDDGWGFTRHLSVTALAAMPIALRGIVQAAYMLVAGKALLHPGLSALTRWSPSMQGRLSYGFLGTVDVFSLWTAALIVVGAVATARSGKGRAALKAIGLIVIAMAITALPAIAAGPLLAP